MPNRRKPERTPAELVVASPYILAAVGGLALLVIIAVLFAVS